MKKFGCLILITVLTFSINAQTQERTVKNQDQKMTGKEIKALLESLENSLSSWYVFHDKVGLMLTNVKKNYTSGIYNKIESRSELAEKLVEDIQQVCPDRHLTIRYYPELAEFLETPLPEPIKQLEIEKLLNEERETNFGFKKTELLQGNVGYLRFDWFCQFIDEAKPTLEAAARFVSNSKALIIDMRYNGGGFPEMVLQVQHYFFTEKTRMNDIIDSKNDTLQRWADPALTNFSLDMPVYILTSRNTFSGAEDFAYGLQQAKRAVVVGETTGGGAHPSRDFSIGQGFVIHIPTHRSSNVNTNTDWEGIGVQPNVFAPAEQAQTKAQILIYTELFAKAKSEEEKYRFHWYVNCIETTALLNKQIQTDSIKIEKELLLNYCGYYQNANPNEYLMPFAVGQNGSKLIRHFDDGYDDALVPISQSKFVIDDNSARTIEFVRNQNGVDFDLILSNQNGVFKMTKRK
jgi:hypothetical protein